MKENNWVNKFISRRFSPQTNVECPSKADLLISDNPDWVLHIEWQALNSNAWRITVTSDSVQILDNLCLLSLFAQDSVTILNRFSQHS